MTATTKRIESTRVETSEGVVFFTIWEEYRDGKLWRTFYSAEDSRERYIRTAMVRYYKTEKGYRAAIKRYSKL